MSRFVEAQREAEALADREFPVGRPQSPMTVCEFCGVILDSKVISEDHAPGCRNSEEEGRCRQQ